MMGEAAKRPLIFGEVLFDRLDLEPPILHSVSDFVADPPAQLEVVELDVAMRVEIDRIGTENFHDLFLLHVFEQSLGQNVSQSLAFADLVHHLDHSVGVAKAQVDAVRVFLGEQAVLVTLHSKSDGHPGADGIERVSAAQFVGPRYGHDVAHATGGAQ